MNGYDVVSSEYYETRHKTCRNFDETTKHHISSFVELNDPIIEVGAGRGRCFEYTKRIAAIHFDSSIGMLNIKNREPGIRILGDAECMPFVEGEFGSVVSFLCDPFLTVKFLSEVHRILINNGSFIFTTPAYEWGVALRGGEKHATTFVCDDGQRIEVPSNLYKLKTIEEMCSTADLRVVYAKSYTLPLRQEPSEAVKIAAKNSGYKDHDLPLIYIIYGKR